MMLPEPEFQAILRKQSKFPCKISRQEGEILKCFFEFQPGKMTGNKYDKKDIQYKYFKELNGTRYVLLEEYQFRDGETFLDLKRAIGINYYLNRIE